MSNHKVKGLLKGLRYISQIFDNEKEQEMQIGNPTDVKHVAHIGWDGPSVNSPSWMNEFKPEQGNSSAPLNVVNGDAHNKESDNSAKWVSEGSRSVNSPRKNLPELPKSSRRQSTGDITDSPTRERADKPRRRSSKGSHLKDSSDGSRSTRNSMPMDSVQGSDSLPRAQPDIPKKTRRKKSKDVSNGGGGPSSKLSLKAQGTDPSSDTDSPSGSMSNFRNKQRSFEEDGQSEKGDNGIS